MKPQAEAASRRRPALSGGELMKNKYVLLAACLASTGCGTHYVAPASGPTTAISVRNQSSQFAAIAVFEDAQECYKSHVASRLDPGKSGEISVHAEKPLAMHYQLLGLAGGPGVAMCNVIITFKPKADRRYTSILSNDSDHCTIDITEIDGNGATREVAAVTREFTPPMGFTNKWCPPLTEQQALDLR